MDRTTLMLLEAIEHDAERRIGSVKADAETKIRAARTLKEAQLAACGAMQALRAILDEASTAMLHEIGKATP